MKSNELRLGNYATDNIQTGVITVFNNDACVLKHKSGIIKCKVSDLNSIPLTEEWLLKFGFEWSIRYQAWHKLSFIFDLSERGVGGYYMHMVKKNNEIICPEIIYVHQLQNLYFALTGEELTFKEE